MSLSDTRGVMEPEFIGDYRILKQLGKGPLGKVYIGEHRFIKKTYVLKVLPQKLTQDRGFLAKFEEEVARFATIEHPHLVRIHNVSFHEGMYFLVTDCVVDSIGETTNLAQYMSGRKERLREEELMSVVKQLADVIDTVHQKGCIHGAINLNNILIGKANPGIEIFVSDLALYKLLNPAAILAKNYLALAETMDSYQLEAQVRGDERYQPIPFESEKAGKLAQGYLHGFYFLAPEQRRNLEITAKVDHFAFGTVVYYLITGKFPEGIFEMPSSYANEYQFDWDRLVKTTLSQDPQKRPDSLMPLLGHKKMATITVESQQRSLAKELQSEKPELTKVLPKPEKVEQEAETPIQESQLVAATASIAAEETKAPVRAYRPVIHRQEVTPAPQPPMPTASVVVEKRDIMEATPKPHTPAPEEYSKVVNAMTQRDPVVKEYHPQEEQISDVEPIPTEMVIVPGGSYYRGSNDGNRDEVPYHNVIVESFAIDIHPVTNEQFVRFLEYMGGEKDQNYHDIIRLKESRINRSGGRLSIESGYAKHPVVGVTWYGAVGYARWVGKRLPTEAEWEIAARGGLEHLPFSTGNHIEKSQANFFSSDTTSVMSYSPNGFGIYDLAGNVYEWCQDWYGYNYYETSAQEPHCPKGPIQGVYRVLRGGCWKSLKEDMRVSHRHRNNPGTMNGTYGFRCAADVQAI